jgi:hypothetical protein
VIGNKLDKEANRQVQAGVVRAWCYEHGDIPYFETSALENISVDNARENHRIMSSPCQTPLAVQEEPSSFRTSKQTIREVLMVEIRRRKAAVADIFIRISMLLLTQCTFS